MQQSEMGQRRENTLVMLCFGDSNTYGYDPRAFGETDTRRKADGLIFCPRKPTG